MSRIASTRHAGAVLERILEQPMLVAAVRELEPAVLHQLIRHLGLEDCGELVALASREQIERVFDEDLWRSEAAGKDARFDPQRFALWLEVLVDQGARIAANKLVELDEDLLAMALSKLIFVIDIESMAVRMANRRADDVDQLEKMLESTQHHEFDHYRVIARDSRAFETVITVLLELDSLDYETLMRMLERCCVLCDDYIEDNGGLYEVLRAGETAEEDVAGERESRREQAGFVQPSSAVASLQLTKQTPLAELITSEELDPISKAYFRNAQVSPAAVVSREHDALLDLLRAAKVVQPTMRQLPRHGGGTFLRRALSALVENAPRIHGERMLELAYLANVLLAAQGMRPVEAAERALELCDRGATHVLVGQKHTADWTSALLKTGLIKFFRVGFHLSVRSTARVARE